MVYVAAFVVGALMCAVFAASAGLLLRDAVDQDRLAHGLMTLGAGATATGLVMLAFPESAVAIAIAYGLGSIATLIAFVFSGLVGRTEPEPSPAVLRPHSFVRDPSSTLH